MEGGAKGERNGGGFPYGNSNNNFHYYNLQNHRSMFQATPRTTPIERFLWSETENNQISQYHQTTLPLNLQPSYYNPSTIDQDSSNILSNMYGNNYHQNEGLSWPSQSRICFSHGQLLNMEQMSLNEQKSILSNASRKNGQTDLVCVIKGQWTKEEDMMLIELVKKHGVKKWSLISQEMNGRVGKQCRERWNNHLRSNIKKEPWSKAEENLLVEAHKKVCNRWCEIAKKIPGRTENSIKNHWNTTKRRLDSRKRGSRQTKQNKNNQSTILEDYIMSYYTKTCSNSTSLPTKITPSMATTNEAISTSENPSNPFTLGDLPMEFDMILSKVNNQDNNNSSPLLITYNQDEVSFIQSGLRDNAFVGSSSCTKNSKVKRTDQQYFQGHHEFFGISSDMDANTFITYPEDNKLNVKSTTLDNKFNVQSTTLDNKYLASFWDNDFGYFSFF